MPCVELLGTGSSAICADVVLLDITVVVSATSLHGVNDGGVADGLSELVDGVSKLVVGRSRVNRCI